MERPIIIWLKDDGKITKEMLEEAVKKAYEQGYEDGKKSVWTITSPDTYPLTGNWWTSPQYTTTNPNDVRVEWTCSDSSDSSPTYLG